MNIKLYNEVLGEILNLLDEKYENLAYSIKKYRKINSFKNKRLFFYVCCLIM